ncbi:hypothetical protein HDZ31DRAFT_71665 [Schizophyllum fasciatum]
MAHHILAHPSNTTGPALVSSAVAAAPALLTPFLAFILTCAVALTLLAMRARRPVWKASDFPLDLTTTAVEIRSHTDDLARPQALEQRQLSAVARLVDEMRVVQLVDEMRIACLRQRARQAEGKTQRAEGRAAALAECNGVLEKQTIVLEGQNAELAARATTLESHNATLEENAALLQAAAKRNFVESEEREAELTRRQAAAEHEKDVLEADVRRAEEEARRAEGEVRRLSTAVEAYESLLFGEAVLGAEEAGANGKQRDASQKAPRSCVETMCAAAPMERRPVGEALVTFTSVPAGRRQALASLMACERKDDSDDDDMTLTAPSTCGSDTSTVPAKALSKLEREALTSPSSLPISKQRSAPSLAPRRSTPSRGRLDPSASGTRLSASDGRPSSVSGARPSSAMKQKTASEAAPMKTPKPALPASAMKLQNKRTSSVPKRVTWRF